jgi:hypothetical protein
MTDNLPQPDDARLGTLLRDVKLPDGLLDRLKSIPLLDDSLPESIRTLTGSSKSRGNTWVRFGFQSHPETVRAVSSPEHARLSGRNPGRLPD